jgi:RNA polymerase sigma-70 factor (ECF subfamily)
MNDPMGYGGSSSKGDSEHELINAIGAGDILAFEALIKRYQEPVLNFVFKYIGDRFAAEDIAQEVFLSVYRSASGFEPKGKVSTWIFKIAYNLSVNEILHRSRLCLINGVDDLGFELVEPDHTIGKEIVEEVMDAVRHLPEKQRAAMLLRVNDGLSYAEISKILSISISSVESLLFRARESLRIIMNRHPEE